MSSAIGIVSRGNRTGTVPFTNLIAEILDSLPGQKIAVNQSTAEECSRNQYPTYVEFDVRQHTFQCRQFNGPAAQDLANAGFFAFRNTNNEDSVCCFCCGVVLTNWTQDDDPWVEHAWWFPECRFLKESKGEGFIQLVQRALDTVRNHTVMIANNDDITREVKAKIEAKFQEIDVVLAFNKFIEQKGRRPFLREFYEFINSWEGMPSRKKSFDTLINENIEYRQANRGVRDENRSVKDEIRNVNNAKRALEEENMILRDGKTALEEENRRLQQCIDQLEGVPLS